LKDLYNEEDVLSYKKNLFIQILNLHPDISTTNTIATNSSVVVPDISSTETIATNFCVDFGILFFFYFTSNNFSNTPFLILFSHG
jgi:hypothetical protein